MRTFFRIALVLAMSVYLVHEPVQAQGKLNQIMAEKLRNAQRLLEGLAIGDFDKISRSAEELIQLSKTAEWGAIKTPRYEVYSNDFRRTAEDVIQKAKNRNIDGVALAYVDMTLTCVRCHQYVREIRDARLSESLPDLASLERGWRHPQPVPRR